MMSTYPWRIIESPRRQHQCIVPGRRPYKKTLKQYEVGTIIECKACGKQYRLSNVYPFRRRWVRFKKEGEGFLASTAPTPSHGPN